MFDLRNKKIYVGNQGIDRVYLGEKLLKGEVSIDHDDKSGFDSSPSNFEIYHTNFKSPDADNIEIEMEEE